MVFSVTLSEIRKWHSFSLATTVLHSGNNNTRLRLNRPVAVKLFQVLNVILWWLFQTILKLQEAHKIQKVKRLWTPSEFSSESFPLPYGGRGPFPTPYPPPKINSLHQCKNMWSTHREKVTFEIYHNWGRANFQVSLLYSKFKCFSMNALYGKQY